MSECKTTGNYPAGNSAAGNPYVYVPEQEHTHKHSCCEYSCDHCLHYCPECNVVYCCKCTEEWHQDYSCTPPIAESNTWAPGITFTIPNITWTVAPILCSHIH